MLPAAEQAAAGRIYQFTALGSAHQMSHCAVQAQGGVLPAEEQAATGRTYFINRIAIRTLWFDRQLLAALDPAQQPQPLLAELHVEAGGGESSGGGGSETGSDGGGSGVRLHLTRNATPRQVCNVSVGDRPTLSLTRWWKNFLQKFFEESIQTDYDSFVHRSCCWALAWTPEHGGSRYHQVGQSRRTL